MRITRFPRSRLRRVVTGTALALTAALAVSACTSSGDEATTDSSSASTGAPTAAGTSAGGSTATAGTAGADSTEGSEGTAGTEGSEGAAETEDADDPAAPAGFSVLGAVAQLPAAALGEQVWITTADLDAATAAAGLTRPTDATEVGPWLSALYGSSKDGGAAPVYVTLPDFFINHGKPQGFADAVGWTLADVSTYVASEALPIKFTVVSGAFDESTLPSTLSDLGDGIVSLGDGEDLQIDVNGDRSVDQMGRPVRLAQQDGRIALSMTTPLVEQWLAGPTSGADGVSGIEGVATALDAEAVASAVIATSGGNSIPAILGSSATPERIKALEQELADNSITKPFDMVGIGWTTDSGVRLVYHFPGGETDAESARGSVEKVLTQGDSLLTGDPIAETLQVDEVSVEAAGNTVVATLPSADGRPGRVLVDMLISRDAPFVYWNEEAAEPGVTESATRSSEGG